MFAGSRVAALKAVLTVGAMTIAILGFLSLTRVQSGPKIPNPQAYNAGYRLGEDSTRELNSLITDPSEEKTTHAPKATVMASATCSQAERLNAVANYCKANPSLHDYVQDSRSDLDIYRKFLVDTRHQILFCQVPKAAGSYWRLMFVKGTGQYSDDINIHRGLNLKEIGLQFLHTFPPEEQRRIIQSYFKVMTVRHPMERAVSAYVDKFTSSKLTPPLKACIDHANKHYRSAGNKIKLKDGMWTIPSGLTWEDFTDLVLDGTSPYNPHWDSAYHLCHPCVISYDYIIRTETMATDAGHILKLLSSKLGEELQLEVVHTNRNNTVETATDVVFSKELKEYGKLPRDKLTKIVDVYRHDMSMYGYDFDEQNSNATCGYDQGHGGSCC